MLARKRTYTHNNGEDVDLPLLVPSFSSKGFMFEKRNGSKRLTKKNERRAGKKNHCLSQSTHALKFSGSGVEESLLISAYDVFHEFFDRPIACIKNAKLVLIDSGGYELATEFDSSEPRHVKYIPEKFSLSDYKTCLRDLSNKMENSGIVFANYDFDSKNIPIKDQVTKARQLFNEFPDWDGNLILKPHAKRGSSVNVDEVIRHAKLLRGVKVIGITEKEIGKNLFDRLRNVAKLRRGLDDAGVDGPIHIWGGLDPILTPLFFFAGAEIFDGVSWLRYAYINGLAVNRESYSTLKLNVDLTVDHSVHMCNNDNLAELSRLATSLREFAEHQGEKFDMFEHNAEVFEQAYRTMKSRIKPIKGGS